MPKVNQRRCMKDYCVVLFSGLLTYSSTLSSYIQFTNFNMNAFKILLVLLVVLVSISGVYNMMEAEGMTDDDSDMMMEKDDTMMMMAPVYEDDDMMMGDDDMMKDDSMMGDDGK
eukprot:TRINITY_DN8620_c0_g1_i1.p5 TRINITY_DN8620_c0_g1~~TRINITY_DN8620_c0_g1_i1.p5  ORF type:complete len:114 (+),score=18.41 TRINITY_DN8620_c0_g1_i1:358-699(+)